MTELICLCGNNRFDHYDRTCFHTTETGEQVPSDHKFGCCTQCGLVRQLSLPFHDEVEYEQFYANYAPTSSEYRAKDWDHDLQLARTRCDVYGINSTNPKSVLDVGSGSGAFVHECRNRNQLAYGCELSVYSYGKPSDFIYRRAFEKINFPVEHFDLVTCHDVLEHALDPIRMLREMHRIMKQLGTCIIDFPRFHHPAGNHHWKDAEHVWFPDAIQLVGWIKQAGFIVERVENPIESKLVIYAKKPSHKYTTILVPPGMGDSYWSIVKMESFLKQNNIGIPKVIPISNNRASMSSRERSVPFIKLFPFLYSNGATVVEDPRQKALWNEAYMMAGRTVFRNVLGYDYFLSWNGYQRIGKRLEDVDPQLTCNWHPRMFVSLEQEQFRNQCLDYGRYIAYYLPFYGVYARSKVQFSLSQVAQSINAVTHDTGCRPVIVGAEWDRNDVDTKQLIKLLHNCVDMTGKTTVEQLFGLLRGAIGVVGHPSGLTILATVLYCPTLIIWNDYYNRDFARYSCPPDTWGTNYFVDYTRGMTKDKFVKRVTDLVKPTW